MPDSCYGCRAAQALIHPYKSALKVMCTKFDDETGYIDYKEGWPAPVEEGCYEAEEEEVCDE